MLSDITLASKKKTIMHYATALNASRKKNDTNNWFGDKIGYFLDRPRIILVVTKNAVVSGQVYKN